MKPATASHDNGAFSAQKSIFGPECIAIRFRPRKSIFEFALRARKITILGALATQFYEINPASFIFEKIECGWVYKRSLLKIASGIC
ncbi:MAG: hypothetical protein ACK5GN_00685 [Pseudomonadota bacterium]